jgi:hypothetical protein
MVGLESSHSNNTEFLVVGALDTDNDPKGETHMRNHRKFKCTSRHEAFYFLASA